MLVYPSRLEIVLPASAALPAGSEADVLVRQGPMGTLLERGIKVLGPGYLRSVMDSSMPHMARFYRVLSVNDPSAFARIATLEYLLLFFKVKQVIGFAFDETIRCD